MTSRLIPISALLFGATMWGLIWYPYRILQEAGVSGVVSSLDSYVIPLAIMLPFLWRHFLTAREHFGWLAILAIAAGWTNVGYVLAVIDGEIVRVVLLFYLAPVWTVIFAHWILGEKLTRWGWLVMACSFSGALVMLWPHEGGLPLPAERAEWIALSAGATFALSNVVTRKVEGADSWAKSLAIWMGAATLAFIALQFETEPFAFAKTAPPTVWALMLGVGIAILFMTLAVQYGLAHIHANQAIAIFLFELIVAALAAWVLAGEEISAQEWIGAAMIVTGSLFSEKLAHNHDHENT